MAERRIICPICRREAGPADARRGTAPFCSRRCAEVDLGRWLGGAYRLEGGAEETAPGDETAG